MSLSTDQITIAVTVFSRRQYLKQAVGSALDQTVPVRVIVVEDHGPDSGLESFAKREFGGRIDYFRNPRRRGLFGNWNACMDYCRTPWLSILHDDDYLAPGFIEAVLNLSKQAPDCGLYFGQTQIVNEFGQPIPFGMRPPLDVPWRRAELAGTLYNTPFPFPGNLFRVEFARQLGGFRETSQFCGDWEMWAGLIANFGAAQTAATVAFNRQHIGADRGTTKIHRNGRLRPLVFVQQKRILRMLRQAGGNARFDRVEFLKRSPESVRDLIRHGAGFSPRLLRYHVGLLRKSSPPSWPNALFRTAARLLGPRFVKVVSRLGRPWLERSPGK